LRALGGNEPPELVIVEDVAYRRGEILKHDSWAATAIYRNDHERRIICKFNRTEPAFAIIPLAWGGRLLAAREAWFLRRLADVELVPKDLGEVRADGRRLANAVARSYVEGEACMRDEQTSPRFFEELQSLLLTMHARGMAYVDLHKRENIIIDRDGRPHLVDFQVCFALSETWPGNGRFARYCLAKLREIDIYHFNKHLANCQSRGMTSELRPTVKLPRIIKIHRFFAIPLRTLRRQLLVALRVRDCSGSATSEAEPEDAYRPRPPPPDGPASQA
jgi:hypothetical protein